jgi:hypothetical protein
MDPRDFKKEEKEYLWVWEEPIPVDNTEATVLNYNISEQMISKKVLEVTMDGKRFEGLLEFVHAINFRDTILEEPFSEFVKHLSTLRAIDNEIENINMRIERPIRNQASRILSTITPVILENKKLVRKIDKEIKIQNRKYS